MNTLKNRQPTYKGSAVYTTILYILAIPTAILMLSPLVLGFMNEFSRIDSNADLIYLILRGLGALGIIVAVNALAICKNVFFCSIPSLFISVAVVFPMLDSINALIEAQRFANDYNMPADLSTYVLSTVEYVLFFLVSVLTFLYCTGVLKLPVAIMALGVPAAMAAAYTVYINIVNFGMDIFHVLTFAYAVTAPLIPVVITLGCDSKKEKTPKTEDSNKYRARRYKN
ncbi:MAG: hypothetical protein Q4D44_06030 [Eubacteriales bacterium]|nr:hypothetical protein [Eubacteriales bacterium]